MVAIFCFVSAVVLVTHTKHGILRRGLFFVRNNARSNSVQIEKLVRATCDPQTD